MSSRIGLTVSRPVRRLWVGALAVMLVSLVSACGGGHKGGTAKPQPAVGSHRVSTGGTHVMQFQLADSSSGSVQATVPSQPIGTAPTSIPGITLQLYLAQRQNPGAVLVIFALDVDATGAAFLNSEPGNWAAPGDALSQGTNANSPNEIQNNASPSVSGVALLDPVGLKEYETFMRDPNLDTTCLCSLADSGFPASGDTPGTRYFAALVAAPPPSVTTVSFVTGLGSIGNVTLSG